jgi:hypothetical protein
VDRKAVLKELQEAVRASAVPRAEEIAMEGMTIIERAKAEGRAEGEAKLLLRLMRQRGLQLSDQQCRHLEACTDPDQIERWADAFGRGAPAEEIFAPPMKH